MRLAVHHRTPRAAPRKPRGVQRLRACLWFLGRGLIGVGLCVALAGVGYMAYRLVSGAAYFRVQTVRLIGHQTLSQPDLLYLLAIPPEATLFQLDLARMGARLGRHPYVQAVTLRRQFPDTLIVTVQEREPYLVVQSEEQRVLLDTEGVVLGPVSPQDLGFPRLRLREPRALAAGMRLHQEEVQRALECVRDYQASPMHGTTRLVALTVEPSGAVVLEVEAYPFTLRLGEGKLDAQLRRLPPVLQYVTRQRLAVRSIDVSYRKRVIVIPAAS